MNNKILCVDDEESILRGFQLNLRKDFELHLASNGKEGLEVFEREKGFALVLSDMRMPEMDGATMLSKIKKIDHEVVTVLLTGHTDFESAICRHSSAFRPVYVSSNKAAPGKKLYWSEFLESDTRVA